MNFDIVRHTILLTTAGSRAYGLHTPTSDVDVKGVAIPPAEYFFGYLSKFDQSDKSEHIQKFHEYMNPEERIAIASQKLEGVVYSLQKFVLLAADANPNILDVLFCRDEEVRLRTRAGDILRENRELFISAKAKHTFSGYAASQLKRIRGHRAWLLNPPKAAPTRAEFDLPEATLIPHDQLTEAQGIVRKVLDQWEPDFGDLAPSEIARIQGMTEHFLKEFVTHLPEGMPKDVAGAKWLAAARAAGASDNLVLSMQREREYESAMTYWKQYQTWKASRNPARAALEAKYGYDTKHGAHLVRLLRMGREILTTGQVNVWRGGPNGDADELLAIRRGECSYDKLVAYAEEEDADLNEIYKSKAYSIPTAPARNKIDELCMDLVERQLLVG